MTSKHGSTPGRLARRAALWASVAVGVLVVPVMIAGCTAAASTSTSSTAGTPTDTPSVVDTYGGMPTFLPKTGSTDAVLRASAEHPALAVEGGDVVVTLADGARVTVNVVGPIVPGEGFAYDTPSTPCTWTVTLSRASRDVPLTVSDFTTLDQLGHVYPLAPVATQPAPPAVVHPGEKVSFELRTQMITGEGLLRWAPGAGPIVSSWDFVVETD